MKNMSRQEYNQLSSKIIGSAIEVHRALGPETIHPIKDPTVIDAVIHLGATGGPAVLPAAPFFFKIARQWLNHFTCLLGRQGLPTLTLHRSSQTFEKA